MDGQRLPSVNFVHRAEDGVVWISGSTQQARRFAIAPGDEQEIIPLPER